TLRILGQGVLTALITIALIAAVCLIEAWAYRRRDMAAVVASGLVAFGVAEVGTAAAMARSDWLWISRGIAEKLDALDPNHQRPVAAVLWHVEHGAVHGYE